MPYTYEKGKWVMDHVNAYSGAEDGVQQGSRIWQPVTNFALNKHSQPDLLKSIVETEYQRVRKVMENFGGKGCGRRNGSSDGQCLKNFQPKQ